MPTVRPLACTRCGAPLPQGVPGVAVATQCPVCHASQQVVLFPAFNRPAAAGAAAELIIAAGEAACFYHAEKRAVVPCDGCGRFLCALCDVKLGDNHFCPACLEARREPARLGPVERGRMRYDQVVWSLLVLPLPLCFPAPFTATAALIVAIWKWGAPPSLVANTRGRLMAGMVVALLELLGLSLFWMRAFVRH